MRKISLKLSKKIAVVSSLSLVPLTTFAGITYKVNNHLNVNSIQGLILAILRIMITLAIPIVVLFIIFAGFKYVTAQGNSQQIKEANRALTYAIIGAILIIGAVALTEIIKNLVDAFSRP